LLKNLNQVHSFFRDLVRVSTGIGAIRTPSKTCDLTGQRIG